MLYVTNLDKWMDGWMDGMDGWMNGWMEGWTEGRTDRRTERWMNGLDGCMEKEGFKRSGSLLISMRNLYAELLAIVLVNQIKF